MMLSDLKQAHPRARILVIVNTLMQPAMADGLAEAAELYGAECVRLEDIDKIHGHPSLKGMREIAEQVAAALQQ